MLTLFIKNIQFSCNPIVTSHMNNSYKKNAPTHFKQNNKDEKRFKERIVSERNTTEKSPEKQRKKTPHFEQEKRGGNKPHHPSNRSKTATPRSVDTRITETRLDNARGSAKVNVTIKSSSGTDKIREKKSGPLSPRAPEKIKKNRAEEMKVYGESACLALFAARPEAIVRVWATVDMAHKIGEMFSYLATNKKVYHVVDTQELALVSGTEHHGGICMLVKKARPFTLEGYLAVPRQRDCLVLLDGVHNAHNIGGILRTCAFYGVKSIVIDDPELLQSAAAMRVAEGGAEYVRALQTNDISHALRQLRTAGYQIVHTTTDKQAIGFAKVRLENKAVFVLSESPIASLAEKDDIVTNLSFANLLNKNGLNVAVQAGVLLAHWVEW